MQAGSPNSPCSATKVASIGRQEQANNGVVKLGKVPTLSSQLKERKRGEGRVCVSIRCAEGAAHHVIGFQ